MDGKTSISHRVQDRNDKLDDGSHIEAATCRGSDLEAHIYIYIDALTYKLLHRGSSIGAPRFLGRGSYIERGSCADAPI